MVSGNLVNHASDVKTSQGFAYLVLLREHEQAEDSPDLSTLHMFPRPGDPLHL
jgi:hypothetical protein